MPGFGHTVPKQLSMKAHTGFYAACFPGLGVPEVELAYMFRQWTERRLCPATHATDGLAGDAKWIGIMLNEVRKCHRYGYFHVNWFGPTR